MNDRSDFTIYPAIDLRNGRVVRLFQGDPKRQTTYAGNPGAVARFWLDAGARWLHVVNLDGAFGEPGQANQAALDAILKATTAYPNAQVQFGGGLRKAADIESALAAGVQRLILGTLAVANSILAAEILARYTSERIALGVDARTGRAYTHGWRQKSTFTPSELGQRFHKLGFRTCVYTNINRDGSGRGVDVEATLDFAQATGFTVIASGGVASLEDVRRVRLAGLSGVIIGRALYDGVVDLQEALLC